MSARKAPAVFGTVWPTLFAELLATLFCRRCAKLLGTTLSPMAREFVYWLRRNHFDGHIYFDTFPRSEDPVRECELNIRTVKRFYGDAAALEADDLQGHLDAHDAMSVLELMERRGMM